MTWNPLDEPCDYILLSKTKSPGLADVTGAGSPRKWDEMGGYGLSGATLKFTGVGLAKFTVTLRLYTAQDWEDWMAWRPLVAKPPLGQLPKAQDILHPFLMLLGIRAVVVEDEPQPEQTEDGVWSIPIKFIQYRKPKFQLVKPDGSDATTTDPHETAIAAATLYDEKQSEAVSSEWAAALRK